MQPVFYLRLVELASDDGERLELVMEGMRRFGREDLFGPLVASLQPDDERVPGLWKAWDAGLKKLEGPSDVLASGYLRIAAWALSVERIRKARAALKKATGFESLSPDLMRRVADLWGEAGQPSHAADAVEVLSGFTASGTADWEALEFERLGWLFEVVERHDEALEVADELIAASSDPWMSDQAGLIKGRILQRRQAWLELSSLCRGRLDRPGGAQRQAWVALAIVAGDALEMLIQSRLCSSASGPSRTEC